jgi:hypothetical protein
MKYTKYLAILAAIVGLFVIGAPVSAAPAPVAPLPAYYGVQGIEIFPGFAIGTERYGAAFIAQATGRKDLPSPLPTPVLYTGPLYDGSLSASINYIGPNPVAGATNTINGGSWTFSVYKDGTRSTITGKIIGGLASWFPKSPTPGTGYGEVTAYMIIVSANGVFGGMNGHTATFEGIDNHASGIFIGSLQVPTISGVLILNP